MPNINVEVSEQQTQDIVHTVTVAGLTLGLKYLWRGMRLAHKFYREHKDTEMTIQFTYGKAFWATLILLSVCFVPCVIAAAFILRAIL
jgi:hypothetical protein